MSLKFISVVRRKCVAGMRNFGAPKGTYRHCRVRSGMLSRRGVWLVYQPSTRVTAGGVANAAFIAFTANVGSIEYALEVARKCVVRQS